MGDHQHGHAVVGQLAHDGQYLAGQLRVQRAGGLVKKDDVRPGGDGAGDGHPLLLPARKLPRIVVVPVGQAHPVQRPAADLFGLGFGHFAGDDQPLGDVLQRRFVAEQVVVLKDKACFAAHGVLLFFADMAELVGLAVKSHGAAVGLLQEIDAAQKRRLAGTAGPQNGHHVALFHAQVHAL